jgi:hypothetical protein
VPRPVRSYDVFEPSGWLYRIRRRTRMECIGAATICMLVGLPALLFWAEVGYPLWRMMSGWIW